MSIASNHDNLLDQLQKEVNLVLEHTARIFQAASTTVNGSQVALASRLKHEFPGAIGRFHDALDQLEDELQTAKLIMRRDLAVHREKIGIKNSPPHQPASSVAHSRPSLDAAVALDKADHQSTAQITGESADVSMTEARSTSSPNAVTTNPEDVGNDPSTTLKEETLPDSIKLEDANADEKPSESLKLDTESKSGQQPQDDVDDDDKAPDTAGTNAFSANADLDSLFNDGASAGGSVSGGGFDGNNNEFDFGNFNAALGESADEDKNDLSSLLPGLSEYANTGADTSGEPDFSALFSTNNTASNPNDENKALDENENDNTFDFMDFANFDASASGGGDVDLEFDFS